MTSNEEVDSSSEIIELHDSSDDEEGRESITEEPTEHASSQNENDLVESSSVNIIDSMDGEDMEELRLNVSDDKSNDAELISDDQLTLYKPQDSKLNISEVEDSNKPTTIEIVSTTIEEPSDEEYHFSLEIDSSNNLLEDINPSNENVISTESVGVLDSTKVEQAVEEKCEVNSTEELEENIASINVESSEISTQEPTISDIQSCEISTELNEASGNVVSVNKEQDSITQLEPTTEQPFSESVLTPRRSTRKRSFTNSPLPVRTPRRRRVEPLAEEPQEIVEAETASEVSKEKMDIVEDIEEPHSEVELEYTDSKNEEVNKPTTSVIEGKSFIFI